MLGILIYLYIGVCYSKLQAMVNKWAGISFSYSVFDITVLT